MRRLLQVATACAALAGGSNAAVAAPPERRVFPQRTPNIDVDDLGHLVPVSQTSLDYVERDRVGPTQVRVRLNVEMTNPAIVLENSAHIADVRCSFDKTSLQFLVGRSEAHDHIDSWNEVDDLILVTDSPSCNPVDERGIYHVKSSSFNIDARGRRVYTYGVQPTTLKDVAPILHVEYEAVADTQQPAHQGLKRSEGDEDCDEHSTTGKVMHTSSTRLPPRPSTTCTEHHTCTHTSCTEHHTCTHTSCTEHHGTHHTSCTEHHPSPVHHTTTSSHAHHTTTSSHGRHTSPSSPVHHTTTSSSKRHTTSSSSKRHTTSSSSKHHTTSSSSKHQTTSSSRSTPHHTSSSSSRAGRSSVPHKSSTTAVRPGSSSHTTSSSHTGSSSTSSVPLRSSSGHSSVASSSPNAGISSTPTASSSSQAASSSTASSAGSVVSYLPDGSYVIVGIPPDTPALRSAYTSLLAQVTTNAAGAIQASPFPSASTSFPPLLLQTDAASQASLANELVAAGLPQPTQALASAASLNDDVVGAIQSLLAELSLNPNYTPDDTDSSTSVSVMPSATASASASSFVSLSSAVSSSSPIPRSRRMTTSRKRSLSDVLGDMQEAACNDLTEALSEDLEDACDVLESGEAVYCLASGKCFDEISPPVEWTFDSGWSVTWSETNFPIYSDASVQIYCANCALSVSMIEFKGDLTIDQGTNQVLGGTMQVIETSVKDAIFAITSNGPASGTQALNIQAPAMSTITGGGVFSISPAIVYGFSFSWNVDQALSNVQAGAQMTLSSAAVTLDLVANSAGNVNNMQPSVALTFPAIDPGSKLTAMVQTTTTMQVSILGNVVNNAWTMNGQTSVSFGSSWTSGCSGQNDVLVSSVSTTTGSVTVGGNTQQLFSPDVQNNNQCAYVPFTPATPAELSSLGALGGAFCTATEHYTAPVVTMTATTTLRTEQSVTQTSGTVTVTASPTTTTLTVTASPTAVRRQAEARSLHQKRSWLSGFLSRYGIGGFSLPDGFTLPTQAATTTPVPIPTNLPFLNNWPPQKILSACSQFATGTVTTTVYPQTATVYTQTTTVKVHATKTLPGPTETVTSTVQPSAQCPSGDQTTYTANDGSTYKLVCGVDYSTADSDIVGINPVQTNGSYTDCINLCSAQGSACAGVTFDGSCYLKSLMNPSGPNSNVYSAVRQSGPSALSSQQQLTNGNFGGGSLAPWTTNIEGSSSSISDVSGAAVFTFSLNSDDEFDDPEDDFNEASIQQAVSSSAGQSYYLQFDISASGIGSGTYCSATANLDDSQIWSMTLANTGTTGVYTSGVLGSGISSIVFQVMCEEGSGTVTASLSNVIYYAYNGVSGSDPIQPQQVQVLTNNEFSGDGSPWSFSATTNRATYSVSNNQAMVNFNQISAQYNTPTYVQQTTPTVQAGQTFRIQAQVYLNINGGGTNCDIQAQAGNTNPWSVSGVTSTQSWSVDVTGTASEDSTYFYLFATCTGSSTAQVYYSDVYLTLNV